MHSVDVPKWALEDLLLTFLGFVFLFHVPCGSFLSLLLLPEAHQPGNCCPKIIRCMRKISTDTNRTDANNRHTREAHATGHHHLSRRRPRPRRCCQTI